MRFIAVLIFLSTSLWGQTCAPATLLKPADSIAASLGDSACQLSDGSLYTTYSLTLPTYGRLQLNVSSDDFSAIVILRDSSGVKIEGGAASFDRTIESGQYTVVVNAANSGQSGKFILNSAFQPEPNTICRILTQVGLNQAVSGKLADASCQSPDGSPYDGYFVSTFGSGTLQVTLDSTDFTGQVILRGSDGRALVSDPKSISLTVLDDSVYTIIAAGADSSARGAYKLTVTFTPADDETCRPQKTLLTNEDVAGSITGDSCTTYDNSSQQNLYYQYYDLNVTAAGLVELRVVPGSEVATYIDIRDASGRLVAEDVQSGGANRPAIRQQLSPGFYNVIVTAIDGVDYTLQFRFSPGLPATCPVLTLQSGVQNGSFDSASSCRSLNVMQDTYRFTLGTANNLDIAIGSSSFNGYLSLADAKDNVLVQNRGEVVADLKAGTYVVRAQSVAPGSYAMQAVLKGENLVCPATQKITVNNGYNGLLGSTACRGADGQPLDVWEFTTTLAGQVGLFMQSQSVDSYLTLTDSQGTVLRRDDNSFGNGDAMIVQWLPSGTYRVNATASGGLQSGQYTLYVLFTSGSRSPGCLPVGDLNPGTIQRTLNINACQYIDDRFADVFQLSVPAATSLDITMTLARYDAVLELLDQKGNLVDVADNSAGGSTAHLTTPVDAGTYYVVAKSYGVTSSYTLAVK